MVSYVQQTAHDKKPATTTMKALVFRGPDQIAVDDVPIPEPGPGEAVIRVTLTTICGTDLHILKGEYLVKPGSSSVMSPSGRFTNWESGSPDTRSATASLSGRSPPAASVMTACEGTCLNAAGQLADGNSGTRSTEPRHNICWSLTRKPTLPRYPMICSMSRSFCSPTSLRRAFPLQKVPIYKSVTPSPSSRKGRSGSAPRPGRS